MMYVPKVFSTLVTAHISPFMYRFMQWVTEFIDNLHFRFVRLRRPVRIIVNKDKNIVYLYGEIVPYMWLDWGFTTAEEALAVGAQQFKGRKFSIEYGQ